MAKFKTVHSRILLSSPSWAAPWKLCNQVESQEELLEIKIFKEDKPERWHNEKQVGGKNKSNEIEDNGGGACKGESKNLDGKIPKWADWCKGGFQDEPKDSLDRVQEKPEDGDYHPW